MPGFTHSQSNWRRVIICLGPSSTSELVTMTFVREGMVDFPETLLSLNTQESCLFEGVSSFQQHSAHTQIAWILEKIQLLCDMREVTLDLQTLQEYSITAVHQPVSTRALTTTPWQASESWIVVCSSESIYVIIIIYMNVLASLSVSLTAQWYCILCIVQLLICPGVRGRQLQHRGQRACG